MTKWKIYTPDGVQDILFNECYTKRNIEDKIRRLFRSYGFFEVETPTIEFFDVFSSEVEHFPQESMVKFFDQKGRILVLRPDITIPVARITATKNRDCQLPLKYSYIGNVFRFNEVGGGRQNEFTQAGVEILGDSSAEADAEIIAVAINTLKATGLEHFQIDIGQVEFFKGLAEDAGFSDEAIDKLSKLIDRKDFTGVGELVNEYKMSSETKDLILKLPGLFGSVEIIKKLKKSTSNQRCLSALENIEEVISILDDYGLSQYISCDLGMLKGLNYDTGIIFRGFTHGVGFPILSGGRYDTLTSSFGKNCPATGFSLGINMLMTALQHKTAALQKPNIDTLICYTKESRKTAFDIAASLRNQEMSIDTFVVTEDINKAIVYAKAKDIGGVIFIQAQGKISVHDITNGIVNETSIDAIKNKSIDAIKNKS